MKKIIIIGAGFAGLTAATALQKEHSIKVTLIDKYENTHFRPLYPDLISNRISAHYLLYPIIRLRNSHGFQFLCSNVNTIDFEKKVILCNDQQIEYDILILACGSTTPIPPLEQFKKFAHPVDTIHDALTISDKVCCSDYDQFVICGGGYTGVEVACQLSKLVHTRVLDKKITIVEMLDSLVNTLPIWMQKYAEENLKRLGVEILLNTKLTSIEESRLQLSNGTTIDKAFLIWSTGLKPSPLTSSLNIPKDHSGRIIVDSNLKFNEHCFAIGDCGGFKQRNTTLRMSVQSSIDQGKCAAINVLRQLKSQPLENYRPFDPGFIIPMTNNIACGEVLGHNVTGAVANYLHYLMSAYRSYGIENRLGIISAAFKK